MQNSYRIYVNHINDKVKSFGVEYLNGKASGNYKPVSINKQPIPKGQRHAKILSYANSLIVLNHKKANRNTIYQYLVVFNNNPEEVQEPLPESELKQIFNDAWNNIEKSNTDISNNNNNSVEADTKNKKELVIKKAKDNIIKFFIDEYKEPYVAIQVYDHLEILQLYSGRFRDWLSRLIYKEDNEVIDSNVFRDSIGILNAEAIFDSGDPIKLNLRVAQRIEPVIAGDVSDAGDTSFRILWYYDLTNNNHEFVEITSEGWKIVKNTELILFRRFNNQAAQVYPLKTEQSDIFDKFIEILLDKNVKEENKTDYRHLLKCYIVTLFIPEISKPVLLPHGSQGALKSTIFEKIKGIVDPSILKTLSFPRDKNEFIQQLGHNYVAYYDNISILKPWISDEICRAVSGSGSSTRKLWTDDDDKIRSFKKMYWN